jgi:hypothetical protein
MVNIRESVWREGRKATEIPETEIVAQCVPCRPWPVVEQEWRRVMNIRRVGIATLFLSFAVFSTAQPQLKTNISANIANQFGRLVVTDAISPDGRLDQRVTQFVSAHGLPLTVQTSYVDRHSTMTFPGGSVDFTLRDNGLVEVVINTARGMTWSGVISSGIGLVSRDDTRLATVLEEIRPVLGPLGHEMRGFVDALTPVVRSSGREALGLPGTQCMKATLYVAIALAAYVSECMGALETGGWDWPGCAAAASALVIAYDNELTVCGNISN